MCSSDEGIGTGHRCIAELRLTCGWAVGAAPPPPNQQDACPYHGS
ncbi:MAG: hypothetical protein ACRDSP_19215 [Pseudonocardiaceae bacterium]